MQTIESTCRGVENCGLEVTGLLLCSDEEGVILDVIAQEVHDLQRVAGLSREVAGFLKLFHPLPRRQLACLLHGLDALVGGHVDGVVIGVEDAQVVAAASVTTVVDALEEAAAVHQFQELAVLIVAGQHVAHRHACSQNGCVVEHIALTVTAIGLVVDEVDAEGLALVGLVAALHGHAFGCGGVGDTNLRAALGAIVFLTVLHISDHDMGVEDVLQAVAHNGRIGDATDAVANLARCLVVVPDARPHTFLFIYFRGVVVEAQQLARTLAVAAGIEIRQQGVVRRDEEAIVGIERVQVDVVLKLLDAPVHDAHRLVDQSGERHTHVSCGRIDAVGEIDGAVAAQPDRVDGRDVDTHGVVGVVEDTVELRRNRRNERTQHVVVDELRDDLVGNSLPSAVVVFQHAAGAVLPVFVESLVARHHHHGHVALEHDVTVLIVQTRVVGIPLGVELQRSVHGTAIRRCCQRLAALRLLGEETLLEHRVYIRAIKEIILSCEFLSAVGIGSTETL